LKDLLQPPVVVEKFKTIFSGDARSLLDMYYDDSNDIAAQPVPATDETKNEFKFILRYCLGFINRIPYDDDEYNDDDDVVVDGQTNRVSIRNRIPQIVDQRPVFMNRIPFRNENMMINDEYNDDESNLVPIRNRKHSGNQIVNQRPTVVNRILDDDEYNDDDNVVVDGQSNRVDIRNIIPHGNQIVNQSRLHDIHNYQYQNENEILPSAPPLPYWEYEDEDERPSVLQRVPTTPIVIPSTPPPPVLPRVPRTRIEIPSTSSPHYKYAKGGRSRRRRRRSEKGSRRRGRVGGRGTGRRKKKRSNTYKIKS